MSVPPSHHHRAHAAHGRPASVPPATDPAEVARLRAEVAHVTRELADTIGDAGDQEAVPDWAWRWAMVLAIVLFAVACMWVTGQLAQLAR